jgi:hypothetical protein
MPDIKNCILVVVDVQGKLAQLMYEKDILFKNIQILIKAAGVLEIPIYISQILEIPIFQVQGWVGGEHGDAALPLWSTTKINNLPVEEYVKAASKILPKDEVASYVKSVSKFICFLWLL